MFKILYTAKLTTHAHALDMRITVNWMLTNNYIQLKQLTAAEYIVKPLIYDAP